MDKSACKVLLKALHMAGRFDDADRVYADVCKLTHTSHWSSVHTAVQTIDFHTYSVHMCYTALRSVFHQVRAVTSSDALHKRITLATFSIYRLLLMSLYI
jgi:hypothetical protein